MSEPFEMAVHRVAVAARYNSKRLDLGNLGLEIIPYIEALPGIEVLDLADNDISVLSDSIFELANVRHLIAHHNRFAQLPDLFDRIPDLRVLSLHSNQISELPDSIGRLSNLQTMNLSGNQLSSLPDSFGGLTSLRTLNLFGNNFTDLPDVIGELPNLETLNISGNPLVSPTPEIRQGGIEAVLAFLRARSSMGTVRQWRSKLLIVGEATVGKTTLSKQLTGGSYDPDEGQTHGVHIDDLLLAHPDLPDTTMSLRVWDFGGQLEYRATQRFYLSDRSLFVLVWNARARWRDGKLLAWLDVITARAPGSPILIVATHGDEPSAALLPDDLGNRYPNIVGAFTVDGRSGNGIDAVREAIRRHSSSLPLMGLPWPKVWMEAAQAVRELPGLAVNAREMWGAMSVAGVTDPEGQRAVALALHDLGDIVHFEDDRELSHKVVLRPQWLDARITAVLDSNQVARARGVLSREEREKLWGDLDDPDLMDRLIRMMERFDLAYRVGDADQSDDVALIVERLGDSRPPEVDLRWAEIGRAPDIHDLGIIFKLKSRQAGIPTWFIAREHHYTTGLHWTHGALLCDRDPENPAYALLIDDEREQPTISLYVRAKFPVRFLSILAEAFKGIVQQRYDGLIEAELVPCRCQWESSEKCNYLFPREQLIAEASDSAPDADHRVRCPISLKKIDARLMLDGLPGTGVQQRARHLNTAAHGLAELDSIRMLSSARMRAGAHCPSLFDVEEIGRSVLLRRQTVRISMWCEWPYGGNEAARLPGGPHRLPNGAGVYTLSSLPDGLRRYLPYLRLLVAGLGAVAPIITPSLFSAAKELDEQLQSSLETADKILDALGAGQLDSALRRERLLRTDEIVGPRRLATLPANFRTLRNALRQLDESENWGGLNEAIRPEDLSVIYVCDAHYKALQYPYTPQG